MGLQFSISCDTFSLLKLILQVPAWWKIPVNVSKQNIWWCLSSSKLKKIQWKSSSYSLLGKYCICNMSLNRQRLLKKTMKEQLFWECTCMITSPLVIGVCFCCCRYCCASVWAFVSWPKGENYLKLIDYKLTNILRAQLEL